MFNFQLQNCSIFLIIDNIFLNIFLNISFDAQVSGIPSGLDWFIYKFSI